ncbi:MAG: signal transduction histidine kinase, LytS [Herbinix sp.]|jgi:sensor histidine kinase YesM|nr:signal transduction histidine kinase, LytS [Herbinix sp.]
MRMKKSIYAKLSMRIVIVVGIIMLFLAVFYYSELPNSKSPQAVKGYLDLSDWDFTIKNTVFLNGEWDFYPGKLLQPEELLSETPASIKVPRGWKTKNEAYVQPDRGNGTYHLSVKLPKSQESFALKIQNIWMAHRLFINGELVKEKGVPADNLEDYRPENTPYLIVLEPGEEIELVIQVSNQVFYTGGISQPIRIGTKQHMETKEKVDFSLDVAEIFLFLLFGIYHIQIYQMRQKETAYLYSGIFLIARSITLATMGEKVLMQLIGALSFVVAYKLLDFTLFLSLVSLVQFIQSLEPKAIKKRTLNIILIPILIFLGLVLFTPYHFYMLFKRSITIYADTLVLIYTLRFIQILFYEKKRKLPVNELIYVVLCVVFIGITILNSLLFYSGYTNDGVISKLSMLGFLLCMNLFLARRFTNKMNEIQVLSKQLIKAGEIKDEFLARTSHELKMPLHGIINIADHLLKGVQTNLSPTQREDISLIQDTSARLSLLVNDLIDIIKLRHEDLQLKLITVDLYVVIQVVFQLLSFDLQGKDLRLLNKVKPMTFVKADENRLRQILYNISSNAMKYTEKGEIIASVKEDSGNIVLTLSDTGRGIPKERWEQLFEDFNHDALPSWEYKQGIGLGLYISRQLARKMKGDVWISDSVVGEGTIMSLRLPKGQLSDSSTPHEVMIEKRIYEPGVVHFDINSSVKQILLVDDEPMNIRVLSLILEGEYKISAACSGEEALKLLQEQKFHLVLADTMMPGMSGIELTQRIRLSHSPIELPIIIATVRDQEHEVELAYQNGANDYITKPFAGEEILLRVRSLLKLTDTMERALNNEIAFLQAQIKPHFIYNALSNIIALCYEDGERAAELLALLSQYLRHIFQMDQTQQLLTLQKELDIIQIYVEIEQLRFGGRLHYETYIDPAVLHSSIVIPALLIQPLVENAIRHGLFNKQGEGTVALSITEGEGFIRIDVEDDGIGMSDDEVYRILHEKGGKGVGIRNVQMRIDAFPKATFLIDSELEKGTKCILFLPKELI